MYAIAFDFDTQTLEETYGGPSWRNAYNDVRSELTRFGFEWKQVSVYFGGDEVTAITCVRAITALTRKFKWFAPSARDVRMLRIEENNDLKPIIDDELQRPVGPS